MRSSIAVLAASVAGALAQSTSTVSLFLGPTGITGQQWAGSVVSAGPSDTVYEIMCTACGTISATVRVSCTPFTYSKSILNEA
jgi:hypothetical protein